MVGACPSTRRLGTCLTTECPYDLVQKSLPSSDPSFGVCDKRRRVWAEECPSGPCIREDCPGLRSETSVTQFEAGATVDG